MVATLGAVVFAVGPLRAVLGGQAGVPVWLRIVLGVLALIVAIAFVVLTWAEQTTSARARARRARAGIEDHFVPEGRGVAHKREAVDYFTGREQALLELVDWLRGDDSHALCAVTGDPGSGRSVVLGRLVTLADAKRRQEIDLSGLRPDPVPPQGGSTWRYGPRG